MNTILRPPFNPYQWHQLAAIHDRVLSLQVELMKIAQGDFVPDVFDLKRMSADCERISDHLDLLSDQLLDN